MKRRCADEWASRHPRRRVEDLSGTSQEQSVCGRRKWASSRLAATAALKLFLYSYFLQPPSDVAQNIHSFSLKCICMLIMFLICYIDLVHMKQYHAGCAVFLSCCSIYASDLWRVLHVFLFYELLLPRASHF